MSSTLEYIDAYFNRELRESERKQFEMRCTTDKEFAEEVAFYIASRGEARKALLQQKQEHWKNTNSIEVSRITPVKRSIVLRWIPYAAAACVILVIAFYFLFQPPAEQKLASQYINNINEKIGQSMSATSDSTQLGIQEYLKGNYQHAVVLFEGIRTKDSTNSDVKKYAGLAYLQIKEYDKALQCFRELSDIKDLKFNSGDMLQAATLLLRNGAGDKEVAKPLLKKVVRENEEDSDKAKEMLEKW